MAGSFVVITHQGIKDAYSILQNLYEKTGDLSEPLADVGEHLLLTHRDRWSDQQSPDGAAWAPLSPGYQSRKQRHADEILRLNDDLRDTLNYHADPLALYFGTPLEYGAAHQFGRDDINLPARPYLGLSDQDSEDVLSIISGYLA
ncbi:phage virion morphogenesis protein [Tolumonas auensis DSM 9187]|uniref:Phage virion morphogenesis protein n=1 Tax=Tolumonas auensis (strain DSM 9187 / NBRC 110442 / TA 4) TaxID=595494 RepID=C4LBD5_TOLAT|nr:phage virion morphogenesis protein [Tolumonas auensis]ACQ92370.1 phage virion morphogenesis protein [Tolumonas auensis DSM 9187]